MVKKYCYIIIATMLFFCQSMYAALDASVDRDTVYQGESFQLTIHAGEQDPNVVPNTDAFTKDFDILSTGQTSQVLISQGKSYTDTLWIFVLSPKTTGTLTIPSITVGNDKTTAITVTVKPSDKTTNNTDAAANDRHVFMQASFLPQTPFVQQQGMYTLKLFYDRRIESPKLTEPSAVGMTFIHLGGDRTYETTIKGKPYQILEVNFATFAQKSGPVKINSPIFSGNALNNQMGQYFSNMWQPFRVSANDVAVNVQPIPAQANTAWWLPAKNIVIHDEWSTPPNHLQAGVPVTRTITLQGADILANQLPEVMPTQIAGFQIYPDKATTDNVTDGKQLYAKRIEKAAYIVNQAGDYTIPAVEIHWWNTQTNQAQTSTIPEIKVKASAGSANANLPAAMPAVSMSQSGIKTMPLQRLAQDVVAEPTGSLWKDKWFWLATISLFIWFVTLISLWHRSYRRTRVVIKESREKEQEHLASIRYARHEVKQALRNDDLLDFKQALITLARATWPHRHFLSLGDIIDFIEDDSAKAALESIDEHLYRGDTSAVDGKAVWQQVERAFIIKKKKRESVDLPPLHKE